jgi:nucleotide-binding universal stress UspA family protein
MSCAVVGSTLGCAIQETTMTVPTLPARIFMATDLSARSDRALSRAALLARSWSRELTVAHVVHNADVDRHDRLMSTAPSWRRPESWAKAPRHPTRCPSRRRGRCGAPSLHQFKQPADLHPLRRRGAGGGAGPPGRCGGDPGGGAGQRADRQFPGRPRRALDGGAAALSALRGARAARRRRRCSPRASWCRATCCCWPPAMRSAPTRACSRRRSCRWPRPR